MDEDAKAGEELVRRLASDELLTEAVRNAVRAAVEDHKRAGNPVAGWRDGKVVIVPPEEIVVPEENAIKLV